MIEKKVRPLMRAVIKEEYVVITGDMMEAVILNQMIYWSERVSDFDKFIAEEQARQPQEAATENTMPLLHGWIHKSSLELKEEIMSMDSTKTISRKLENLVAKGFLDRRNNPQALYDRKYQYRVNFTVIIEALAEEGYALEGYKVELPSVSVKKDTEPSKEQPDISDGQIGDSIGQNDKWKGHADESNGHGDSSKGHSVAAIPETTSEIIPEITLSSTSYSPMPKKGTGKKDDKTGELDSFFDAMGINRLKRTELVPQMKAVIADLWRTNRIGRNTVSHDTVNKALSCLTPELIEAIFKKFERQEKKGQVAVPTEYIKAMILNAPQDGELIRLAQISPTKSGTSVAGHDAPSYDIDEFVRLSMMRVNNMQK
jgi:DNA-binding MarR family transcriptional regulator